MSELYKKVIRAIKCEMFKNGMNIKQTSEAVGVHRVVMGQYLNLRITMPGDVIIRLINYFEIDLCAVLGIPHKKTE